MFIPDTHPRIIITLRTKYHRPPTQKKGVRMKKIIPITLTISLLLSLITACTISNPEGEKDTETRPNTPNISDSDDTADTEAPTDTDETPDELEKYPDIPSEYHTLLDAYIEALTHDAGGEAFDVYAEYPNLPDLCKSTIYEITVNQIPQHMGYATKDLNNDGKPELFFLNTLKDSPEEYTITAIFTINTNGEPHLVLNLNTVKNIAAITSDGLICFEGYSSGSDYFYYVLGLSDTAELCGTVFGSADISKSDATLITYEKGNSYYQYPHKFPENNYEPSSIETISQERYTELRERYLTTLKECDSDGCGDHNHVTRDAGLTVYTVFDPVEPK